MGKLLLGLVLGVVLTVAAAFCYVRFGYIDSRADIPVGALEERVAMPALDASVDRRAPEAPNPIDSSDASLLAGMSIYQTNCALCHGDVTHPQAALADAFYPRAPQFVDDAPDMPENQNYYIVQHGVRLSGMPAWKGSLSDTKMWQVTTFLSHMDKLPVSVSTQWSALAGPASANPSASPSPSMDKNMHMK